jgi:hypothetical protein
MDIAIMVITALLENPAKVSEGEVTPLRPRLTSTSKPTRSGRNFSLINNAIAMTVTITVMIMFRLIALIIA